MLVTARRTQQGFLCERSALLQCSTGQPALSGRGKTHTILLACYSSAHTDTGARSPSPSAAAAKEQGRRSSPAAKRIRPDRSPRPVSGLGRSAWWPILQGPVGPARNARLPSARSRPCVSSHRLFTNHKQFYFKIKKSQAEKQSCPHW